jgi:CysZ protein
MFASAARAFRLIFAPGFAGIALRSALLSLLLFLIGLAGAEFLIVRLPVLGNPVVNRALELLAPVLFVFLLSALGAPEYPGLPALPGQFWPGLKVGLRLAGMVLGADVLLLPLDIGLPGIGQLLSLIVNGWLLGWEYFELAALRHLSVRETDALRKSHGWQVWTGGILIALLSDIPLLDLIAPLFGTALMVHLFHRIRLEKKA